MTDLSPAAQAVLDAANTCNSYGPDDCLNESRWIVAAALRAAAECSCEEQDEPPAGPYEQGYLDAIEWVFKRLNTIAAELEGTCDKTSTSADQ